MSGLTELYSIQLTLLEREFSTGAWSFQSSISRHDYLIEKVCVLNVFVKINMNHLSKFLREQSQ